jgi:hypothetical protein
MDKSSEEWRNICEAKDLLSWPLAKRRKQLALVLEKRGEAGYYKLTEEMTKQWLMTKNQQQKQGTLSGKTQKPLQAQQQIDLI